ncbi:PSP1 domain-containing protein [Desulfothermus sp.]
MRNFVGVKFRDYGQVYFFVNDHFELKKGDKVVVSTEEGVGLGVVCVVSNKPPKNIDLSEIKPIDRLATEDDLIKEQENKILSKEAFDFCKRNIEKLGLEMKLVDVEVRFDRSKIIFYFTAPTRVDFRELVKILVRQYHTRIELRQIGVRHEAQMVGGVGNCGRICCCRLFLKKFEPVTIKMAKEQQLFLNPSKISGTCGRLLCCLNFERELYTDFQKRAPKIGRKYVTRLGEVRILRANIFRDSLIVDTGAGVEREISLTEWFEITEGKGDLSHYKYLFSAKSSSEVKISSISLPQNFLYEDLEEIQKLSEEEDYNFSIEEINGIGSKNKNSKAQKKR